jgi:hypothetical protein
MRLQRVGCAVLSSRMHTENISLAAVRVRTDKRGATHGAGSQDRAFTISIHLARTLAQLGKSQSVAAEPSGDRNVRIGSRANASIGHLSYNTGFAGMIATGGLQFCLQLPTSSLLLPIRRPGFINRPVGSECESHRRSTVCRPDSGGPAPLSTVEGE